MPNYCSNKLIIFGEKEQLDSFISKHIKTKEYDMVYLDFDTIIPEPKTKEECEKEYIIDNIDTVHINPKINKPWFNWLTYHCNKWGTKWNSFDGILDRYRDKELQLYFETAWDPCVPIINKLIEMYPDLEFRYYYYEPGMQLAGSIVSIVKVYKHHIVPPVDIHAFAINHGFEIKDEEN